MPLIQWLQNLPYSATSTWHVYVGGTSYEVYGGYDAFASYAMTSLSSGTFASLSADAQRRLLVTATRRVDSYHWQGTPTTPAVGGTTLAWPRTGIAGVDPALVPLDIIAMTFAIAMQLLEGIAMGDGRPSRVRRAYAGGASVSYSGGSRLASQLSATTRVWLT